MLAAFLALVLVLTAVTAVCLVEPLIVELRAPDGGIASIRLRHPALSVHLRLPDELLARWIRGDPEPPPLAGHVAGIPLPRRALAPVAEAAARRVAGVLRGERRLGPPPPERAPDRWRAAAPRAAWEERARLLRTIRVDRFAFDLDYGTGDPVSTGLLAGALWQLVALLPPPCAIRAEASWLEPRLRIEGDARILIFPWRLAVAALCLGLAAARAARDAARDSPPSEKENDPWPSRTEAPAAVAPPSSPS